MQIEEYNARTASAKRTARIICTANSINQFNKSNRTADLSGSGPVSTSRIEGKSIPYD